MNAPTWTPRPTSDGSYTFFSETFQELFHSWQGARDEAFLKFAQAADLSGKAANGQVKLLDVCYGLGYNTAAALETIWATNPDCQVELYGLELDATVPIAALEPPMIDSWSPVVQQILTSIAQSHRCVLPNLQATLLLGDARQTLQTLGEAGWQADAIFFDPFSPRRCPQLWTIEFLTLTARCLASTGRLVTYSRSAAVRSALLTVGLQLGTIPIQKSQFSHEWSQGTVAAFTAQELHPLSPMEEEHLRTRAAVPYRDPTLQDSAEVILKRHQAEQQQSSLEATTQWRRRWGVK